MDCNPHLSRNSPNGGGSVQVFQNETPPEGTLLTSEIVNYHFITVLTLQCPSSRVVSGSIRLETNQATDVEALMSVHIFRVFLGRGGIRDLYQEVLLSANLSTVFSFHEMADEVVVVSAPLVISSGAIVTARVALRAHR